MPQANSHSLRDDQMNMCDIGVPTLHTRVETWECDHNDHWNTRFYGRSFQSAAECVATRYGEADRTSRGLEVQHIRFHQELFALANVEVRSAFLSGGGNMDDAVVHVLAGGGKLAATALNFPAGGSHLPRVAPENVSFALPRGIRSGSMGAWTDSDDFISHVELGAIRPSGVDHTGQLLLEELIRCGGIASNFQMSRMGFTPVFMDENQIGRMAVEMRITRHSSPAAGTHLCGKSRLSNVREKSFLADHIIMTDSSDIVATLEICVVTVDLDTRRAIQVPEVIAKKWHGTLDKAD